MLLAKHRQAQGIRWPAASILGGLNALARPAIPVAPNTPSARQAIAALLGLLGSKEWRARVGVLQMLELFGPSAAAAIPKIRALTDDPQLSVREAAETALARIENRSVP